MSLFSFDHVRTGYYSEEHKCSYRSIGININSGLVHTIYFNFADDMTPCYWKLMRESCLEYDQFDPIEWFYEWWRIRPTVLNRGYSGSWISVGPFIGACLDIHGIGGHWHKIGCLHLLLNLESMTQISGHCKSPSFASTCVWLLFTTNV